ncbi:hypothetical protein WN944_001008 [Citrus x changshan-huyou]|uniref:Uncharacterized protein n=1 Tax=Citrus x changshan-huyou TaxID=2935761 RepID=A0AAP0MDW5_9ROSI
MGLGSKIFLLVGLVITIVVLLTSTKVTATRNLAEASTAMRKAESDGMIFGAPCHADGGCP